MPIITKKGNRVARKVFMTACLQTTFRNEKKAIHSVANQGKTSNLFLCTRKMEKKTIGIFIQLIFDIASKEGGASYLFAVFIELLRLSQVLRTYLLARHLPDSP